jgi:hypothetical protein
MRATYLSASLVQITLAEGETIGCAEGPSTIEVVPQPGLAIWDEIVAAGAAPDPSLIVPDNPTLSDWRVGLTLWGRIDDVTARVANLVASTTPAQAMLGKIAKERLEYANNVLRAQLLQLKDAFGFSEADVDESLWRAHQVSLGDLSGVWPLPASQD